MLAVDTETTGLDLYHGARPFFLTTCDSAGNQEFWEWEVDPYTRKVQVDPGDLKEIAKLLSSQSGLVLQNSKFDVAMLRAMFHDHGIEFTWNWSKTEDTLIAGHILASNKPHDLTSMALQYLGHNIEPYEKRLEEAVKKARSHCQHRREDWRIAKNSLPEMPSAKDKTWKYDCWLPKRLAIELGEPDDHPWFRVLQEYANADSETTVALWPVMYDLLCKRGLQEIYHVRKKAMELAHRMEWRGITGSRSRTEELDRKYSQESQELGNTCVAIAASYGYELELPKSGNNNSLKFFCFGRPVETDGTEVLVRDQYNPVRNTVRLQQWLNLPVVARTDSGQPSMDKVAMTTYLETLPDGQQKDFIKALSDKRSRDTARTYMNGYRRFMLPWMDGRLGDDWYVLHPSLNPCGTDTLRWSSQNPNEQNISKREGFNLRYCFGPAPGREWWSLDAKNIELRIPFYLAGETELIELFERPDDPPYYGSNHLLNFHTIYPDLWEKELAEVGIEKVGPHCKKKYASTWYQYCKNMGFAKQYGAQKGKVDATAKRAGAFELIESRFNKLAVYTQKQIRFANKYGYIETVPDRTVNPKRGYPLLCTRTDDGRILPTVPLSYHVQGTAMWWTFKAMIRVQAKLDEWNKTGFDGHIALQVHDELVLDLPKRGDPSKWIRSGPGSETKENRAIFLSTNLWRIEIIRKLMAEGGNDIGVPTPVGCEYHPVSWDTGVTLA